MAGSLRPPRRRTPSQWANECRVLAPDEPEPGPWRSERAPYMIAITDAAVNPIYAGVIAVMGTQMGKTGGLLNICGRKLDDDPGPVLWVGPTKSNVQNVIEPQIEKMVRYSPSLVGKRAPSKRRAKLVKIINGATFRLAWAGSATELASQPAHTVVVDERDKMKPIPGEGDVLVLAKARTSNFAGSIVVGTSSPTEGNVETTLDEETGQELWALAEPEDVSSPIWILWQLGTRLEFAWPCLHCHEYFVPRLKYLTGWPDHASPIVGKRTARVACWRCGGLHENQAKDELNARGRYVGPGVKVLPSGEVIGHPIESEWATFWVSGLCSPWVSFGERAHEWLRAARSHDQETIRSVINTGFGELYRNKGEAPPWEDLRDKSERSTYQLGDVPEWAQLFFLTVDVQKDHLVCSIRGWGYEYRSLLIAREELWGPTDQHGVWKKLDELLERELAPGVLVDAACIDAGYRPERVYDFIERHRGLVRASRGRDKPSKLYAPRSIETNRLGKKLWAGLQEWIIDHGYFKGWVHDRLNYPDDADGAWLLPKNVGEDYCKQIVAEQRMRTPAGSTIWVKRATNDWLDCEAMQAFLAHVEGVRNLQPPGGAGGDDTGTLEDLSRNMNEDTGR